LEATCNFSFGTGAYWCLCTVQLDHDFPDVFNRKENSMTSLWPGVTTKLAPLLCRWKDEEAAKLQRLTCSTSSERKFHGTPMSQMLQYLTKLVQSQLNDVFL
jgi:hypothetical protein